jgi:hypothetical protein
MAMNDLSKLLIDLWRLSQPTATAMPESFGKGNVDVDGVSFTLSHGGDLASRSAYVYADFGPLPEGPDALAALKRLMEINLFVYSDNAPSFGLNADDGHVVFACRLLLDGLDAARLAQDLGEIAGYARIWRQDHYLKAGRSAAAPVVSTVR